MTDGSTKTAVMKMPVNDNSERESEDNGRPGVVILTKNHGERQRASTSLTTEPCSEQASNADGGSNQLRTGILVDEITTPAESSQTKSAGYDAARSYCRPAIQHEHTLSSDVVSHAAPSHARARSLAHTVTLDRHISRTGSDLKARTRKPNHKQGVSKVRKPQDPKAQNKVPQAMQMRWRVGAAPSVALALSKEEKQISQTISQAIAYYSSMSEVIWGPRTRKDMFFYDLDNRVEVLRDSTVTAASLVAADKMNSAKEVLDRVLPGIDDQLRNPHPAMYLMMAELALNLVKTPGLALRKEVKRYIAARASVILGAEHPLTSLLRLELPQGRNETLAEQLWDAILPILTRSFGADHYQTSTQVYVAARNLASCGRTDEAVSKVEKIIDRWCQLYGSNSLIVCYSKIELANMLANAGSGMKAEFVVSDALRTSDIIHAAELRNEDCSVSEKRHRESSIAFPRVAGLRTLGRLHNLRGNCGAAAYYYSQAVAIGTPSLGTKSAAVELAQAELESVRKLELRKMRQEFAQEDLSELTHIVASPIL